MSYMIEEEEDEKPNAISIAAMQIIVDQVVKHCELDEEEAKQEVAGNTITVKLGESAAIKWLQRIFPKKKDVSND